MYIIKKGNDMMNELYHHGIKGQKWGVRRYQNKDGTYTELGKRHNFEKIEKAWLYDVKTGYRHHNSGRTYRKLARKNPDLAKAIEPAIKSKQKLFRAMKADNKLIMEECDKLVEEYVKKHRKQPDSEKFHAITEKAVKNVGTPNYDAQIEICKTIGRNVVDNVLGKYGEKKLNTFNVSKGQEVLLGYITIEAQIRNENEDKLDKLKQKITHIKQ